MKEEIEVVCPACSPKFPVTHYILRDGQNPVVQCQECGEIHPVTIEAKKTSRIKVIISKDDRSFTLWTRMDEEEMIYVDDEIVIDDEKEEEVFPIIVTSIESNQKRVEASKSGDIDTLWGRAIGEVTVKIAIKASKETVSIQKKVPGDREFVVGDIEKMNNKELMILRIKVRDGGFMSKRGDRIPAKYIKRIYTRQTYRKGWGENRTAWSRNYREKN